MTALPLSPEVFVILSALIEERIGIHYRLDDRDLLSERLTPRAIERGFDSLFDYYRFLRYDPAAGEELHALADALVVNETYFFREADQLRVLAHEIVPEILKRRAAARVWCAACSTGEEPLTVAMLLAQRGLLDKVELIASDISQRVLARARQGEYGQRSLRAVPSGVVGRWLLERGEVVAVEPSLFGSIEWRQVNLLDAAEVGALGSFDAILCRNVLIYFREDMVRSVVNRLAASMRPDGYLLVGASESLLRYGTSLSCEERGGAFFYRKEH
jgi:chemotaxis protein methyltransferase CheR